MIKHAAFALASGLLLISTHTQAASYCYAYTDEKLYVSNVFDLPEELRSVDIGSTALFKHEFALRFKLKLKFKDIDCRSQYTNSQEGFEKEKNSLLDRVKKDKPHLETVMLDINVQRSRPWAGFCSADTRDPEFPSNKFRQVRIYTKVVQYGYLPTKTDLKSQAWALSESLDQYQVLSTRCEVFTSEEDARHLLEFGKKYARQTLKEFNERPRGTIFIATAVFKVEDTDWLPKRGKGKAGSNPPDHSPENALEEKQLKAQAANDAKIAKELEKKAKIEEARRAQELVKQKKLDDEYEALRIRTAHFQGIVDDIAKRNAAALQEGTAGSEQKKPDSEKPKKKRIRYPEAVMVCTHPTGPKGKFRCANPLNTVNGHLKNISGWRTPQEMVESFRNTCPDPRPLNSSTHLVWGCGFAATGLNNAMDRGQGVGIDGRRSYYCSEKEASCRRTSPD